MSGYDFDKYVCKVTGLPCCGCSLFCEHRKEKRLCLKYLMGKILTM